MASDTDPQTSSPSAGYMTRSAADRILMQLKMHGPLTAADLGKRTGTTGEAARQQLSRLAETGLVTAESRRSGVGRPRQLWSLTPAGEGRFPDTHASLTVELLDNIRAELGEAALETVIAARERRTGSLYRAAMEGCDSLDEKLTVLTRLRSAEGYMADWYEAEDGTRRLVEHHCPICAAATACQGFCRSELAIFRQLLGPSVDIRRDEHIVKGGRRCTYVVSETR